MAPRWVVNWLERLTNRSDLMCCIKVQIYFLMSEIFAFIYCHFFLVVSGDFILLFRSQLSHILTFSFCMDNDVDLSPERLMVSVH